MVVASLLLTTGACGSGSGSTAGATSDAPAVSASGAGQVPAAVAASPTPADDGGSDCGGKAGPVVAALKGRTEVVRVAVIGGCHQASISTNLPADLTSTKAALAICDAAATAAYANGLLSVSVDGQDGHELAAGLKDTQCIGG